jgi:hypothetical protein
MNLFVREHDSHLRGHLINTSSNMAWGMHLAELVDLVRNFEMIQRLAVLSVAMFF